MPRSHRRPAPVPEGRRGGGAVAAGPLVGSTTGLAVGAPRRERLALVLDPSDAVASAPRGAADLGQACESRGLPRESA
jgi:hypothetical protein